MKALILLGTLKKSDLSNTATLLKKYNETYSSMADKMIRQLLKFAV